LPKTSYYEGEELKVSARPQRRRRAIKGTRATGVRAHVRGFIETMLEEVLSGAPAAPSLNPKCSAKPCGRLGLSLSLSYLENLTVEDLHHKRDACCHKL
jgi:hypothetical protein